MEGRIYTQHAMFAVKHGIRKVRCRERQQPCTIKHTEEKNKAIITLVLYNAVISDGQIKFSLDENSKQASQHIHHVSNCLAYAIKCLY